MEKINKELEKDFLQKRPQDRPAWIFFTMFVLLVQTSPSASDLILDIFPSLYNYEKWIKLSFIAVTLFVFGWVYWFYEIKKKSKINPDKMTREEKVNYLGKKAEKEYKRLTWRQNIFKSYPLNIITLRFIPLFICRIIRLFLKKYKPYYFNSFAFPKYWENFSESSKDKEKYNYEKVTSKFFESMFRVYIESLKQSYEVKFERDFQSVEIRWTDKGQSGFSEPKNDLYEKIFSEDRFKHIKIFTWIFPFGLFWHLGRLMKNLSKKL